MPKLLHNPDKSIDQKCINEESFKTIECFGEKILSKINKGTHVQLVRRGFYIVDSNNNFIRLPDSKKINNFSAYYK